jgi:dTMP kinase
MTGFFVSFEGIDGSGKTTQVEMLHRWLETQDIDHVITREPGGTPLGKELRQILLHGDNIHPLAEMLLFQADRAQHYETIIKPALEANKVVICDRCLDSCAIYQSRSGYMSEDMIDAFSSMALCNRLPDITIFLDVDPRQAMLRNANVHTKLQDKNDTRDEAFYVQLREGFVRRATSPVHQWRFKRVDASGTPEQVHEDVLKTLVCWWLDNG